MLGPAHQILVTALSERPELLGDLLERLLGRAAPAGWQRVDSTVRFVVPDEVRPDLLFVHPPDPWLAAEVQGTIDPEKARRWLVLTSVLTDQHGRMGDLIVITPGGRTLGSNGGVRDGAVRHEPGAAPHRRAAVR